jgi:hypothetical protein
MATQQQRDRLRADLQLDTNAISDVAVDDLFDRAVEEYGADKTKAINAYVRYMACRQLMMQAAKRVDYRQNQTDVKASQSYAHLASMLKVYQTELQKAEEAIFGSAVRFGGIRRKPTRVEDYPDTHYD